MTDRVTIRPGAAGDEDALVNLVRELAVYEKLEGHAKAAPGDFRRHLFGPKPAAETLVAEEGNEAVGFALFFPTFSTFRGQPGIYLEDLFVKPAHRGKGIGGALLASVAKLAVSRGCGRVEWSVLNWNEPAIGFYKAAGARPMDEWTVYRVDEEALATLASRAPEILPESESASG